MGCFECMKVLVFTTILLLSLHKIWAVRPTEGEQWLVQKQNKNIVILQFQSLQRGPVRPSQKNPCSTIPGRCTLSEMNVAGHLHVANIAPPAFPDIVLKFGAASSIDASYHTQTQGLSS